jgi:hypothetical protein
MKGSHVYKSHFLLPGSNLTTEGFPMTHHPALWALESLICTCLVCDLFAIVLLAGLFTLLSPDEPSSPGYSPEFHFDRIAPYTQEDCCENGDLPWHADGCVALGVRFSGTSRDQGNARRAEASCSAK